MKCNIWKVLFAFSVLLMFAFAGELAAQPTELTITPVTTSVDVEDDQVTLTVTLTDGTGPVEGETISFTVLNALGAVAPTSDVTDDDGRATTTYDAGTVVGVDTVQALWTDVVSRAELKARTIITIGPGSVTKVSLTPVDTTFVVTDGVTYTAELQDDYDNHVDATVAGQVTFSAPAGQGTFAAASVVDNKIQAVYNTDDTVATDDEIIATLVATGFPDTSYVSTVGAVPATVTLTADDGLVMVSDGDYSEEIEVALTDQYGNVSGIIDPHSTSEDCYEVNFAVSAGGGGFDITGVDKIMVHPTGKDTVDYLSSMTTGVYTITGTSEGIDGTVDVTQYPDEPATIVITPKDAGVPAGADTVFVASASDQYSNHIDMGTYGTTYDYNISFSRIDGSGSLGTRYLEGDSLNWKIRYFSYPYSADTSVIRAYWYSIQDEVTLFSAEPGDLHHFKFYVMFDSSLVSDGDIEKANLLLIEPQDVNNIPIYTYDNDDTIELALTESAAADSQVTWFLPDFSVIPTPTPLPSPMVSLPLQIEIPIDTVVGRTAKIPPGSFIEAIYELEGLYFFGIANQVAETANVTATDTAGHTGTSDGITWLPDTIDAFRVQLEGGVTTINANDTVNVELAAIDAFGNPTAIGLPLNVVLSANSGLIHFPTGATQLMAAAIVLYPTVVVGQTSGLIITAADLANPSTNGSSDPIEVLPAGIADTPVKWNISVKFASGDITYAVPVQSKVTVTAYNKVGMAVGVLADGEKGPGYYQASLKNLNLSSDIYFVVMEGEGFRKAVKTAVVE